MILISCIVGARASLKICRVGNWYPCFRILDSAPTIDVYDGFKRRANIVVKLKMLRSLQYFCSSILNTGGILDYAQRIDIYCEFEWRKNRVVILTE